MSSGLWLPAAVMRREGWMSAYDWDAVLQQKLLVWGMEGRSVEPS